MSRMGGMGRIGRPDLTLHHPPISPILPLPPISSPDQPLKHPLVRQPGVPA
jgi:hypothetical protein